LQNARIMKKATGKNGYVHLEAVFAVALVALLGIAVAPALLEDLRSGKVARAQCETGMIAQAMIDFYRDVGSWPAAPAASEADQTSLVGNGELGGGNVAVPAGFGIPTLPLGGRASGTVSAHLIRNRNSRGEPLYRASSHPYLEPGWNGPYLEKVPLDPWGRSYVVSVIADESAAGNAADRVALVVSAGPDGILQTALDTAPPDGICSGDDIGLLIHPPLRAVP
jgi:type II secretory pathway pseudopilin PulG